MGDAAAAAHHAAADGTVLVLAAGSCKTGCPSVAAAVAAVVAVVGAAGERSRCCHRRGRRDSGRCGHTADPAVDLVTDVPVAVAGTDDRAAAGPGDNLGNGLENNPGDRVPAAWEEEARAGAWAVAGSAARALVAVRNCVQALVAEGSGEAALAAAAGSVARPCQAVACYWQHRQHWQR